MKVDNECYFCGGLLAYDRKNWRVVVQGSGFAVAPYDSLAFRANGKAACSSSCVIEGLYRFIDHGTLDLKEELLGANLSDAKDENDKEAESEDSIPPKPS